MERSCLTIIVGILAIHISNAALPTGCTGVSNSCPANSACAAGTCACDSGFKLNSAQDGCETKVLGDSCDSTNGCVGLSNTACTKSKCECTTGYAEKSSVCTKTVTGTSCSANGQECGGISNSHCDTTSKCKCNDGFVMHVDACTADSSAISVQFSSLTFLLSVFCYCTSAILIEPGRFFLW